VRPAIYTAKPVTVNTKTIDGNDKGQQKVKTCGGKLKSFWQVHVH